MTTEQFAYYLNGFIESLNGQQPTPAQWETIKQTLKESLNNVVTPVVPTPRFQIEKEPYSPSSSSTLSGSQYRYGSGVADWSITGSPVYRGLAITGAWGYGSVCTSFPIATHEEPAVLNSPLDRMWLPVPLRNIRDMIDRIT